MLSVEKAETFMAERDDSCYGEDYEEPDDCSISSRSLIQASRLIEERIRNFDSFNDACDEYDSFGDDLQLHSDDFNMSLFPTDSQKLPVMSPVPFAAADQRSQCAKPKPRPVPRPRISKMLPRTAQPVAAAIDLGTVAVTSGTRSGSASDSCIGSENSSSDTRGIEPRRAGDDLSIVGSGSDLVFAPDDFESYAATPYRAQLEFAQKLGFSEADLRAALAIAGPEADMNKLLSALIQVHDADSTARTDGPASGDVSSAAVAGDLSFSLQQLQLAATMREHTEAHARYQSDDAVNSLAHANVGGEDGEDLRAIVIDGSNVAMSHGNKQVFSCRGIQIVVNWFRQRGHKSITVFVPQWRKETSYPMAPISDQYVLDHLEQEKVLAYTPSRRLHGRRVACYDDRYILQLASSEDAVVVSNDNYRDLAKESPAFKRVVEERLLMYTFVNDRFMPPDDPLGRHGPTLDQFLRHSPAKGSLLQTRGVTGSRGFGNGQPCPYGRKCTYGVKCKYAHPERSAAGASGSSSNSRMLGSALPVTARPAANYATKSRTRSPVMRSMSSNYASPAAPSAAVVWSLGAAAPDDENRTQSLPADCSAVFVTTAGCSPIAARATTSSPSRRLRTDTDVLMECEKRLAAATALPMLPAAPDVPLPPGARWRRSLPPDTAINPESQAMAAAAAAVASGGYGWHGSGYRPYEDRRVADAAVAHFMSAPYELDSSPANSETVGGGGVVGSSYMQNLLHRQHSSSEPHLSGGYYSSSSDGSHSQRSSSPYASGGGELVARTSRSHCTSDQPQPIARPISTPLYASAQQLMSRGPSPSCAYQEVIPNAAPSWPYFGDAYSPPPHLLLPSNAGSGGRQYAGALQPHSVAFYGSSQGGGQPPNYGFVSGASIGVSNVGNGHASVPFVDAYAQQAPGVLTRNTASSVDSAPIEDGTSLLAESSAGASGTGFGQY